MFKYFTCIESYNSQPIEIGIVIIPNLQMRKQASYSAGSGRAWIKSKNVLKPVLIATT